MQAISMIWGPDFLTCSSLLTYFLRYGNVHDTLDLDPRDDWNVPVTRVDVANCHPLATWSFLCYVLRAHGPVGHDVD